MNIQKAITKLIKDNKTTQGELANRLGLKSQASIANIISRGDCKVSALYNMCNELGYDVVLKPRHGDGKAERTITIDELDVEEDKRGKFER